MCVIAEIGKQKSTEFHQAINQLTAVAIFFAMQSCEYLKVIQAKKGQINILCFHNPQFFRDRKLIEHNDQHLEFSDCISITFEMQKKDERNNTVTQMALGDINMCPMRRGPRHVIAAMKDTIIAIGKVLLHIKKSEIGTHLLRLGVAMAMFLSNCSVCQIMMIGHWSKQHIPTMHIRKQVE